MSDLSAAKRRNRWIGAAAVLLAFVLVVGGCSVYYATKSGDDYDADNPREATAQCEARVEERLKAPATAEFDSVASGGGAWTVTGTVDAENSFGATVRNDYQCTVVVDGDKLTTTIDFIR